MDTVSIKTSMGAIADSGSVPIRKRDIPTIPLDSKMLGNNLANRVIAQLKLETFSWHAIALEVIAADIEARAQFILTLDADLKAMRTATAESMGSVDKHGKANPSKEETKLAGKRVASATNRTSVMRGIAYAWNNGGDTVGLFAHVAEVQRLTPAQRDMLTLADCGLALIYEYAKKFTASKAGPKPKPWLDKLNKWLEENKGREDDAQDQAYRDVVLAFVATLK